ncbi:MAG: ABC transporter ATP-binding protein [Lachnospiraceae bacterium]|nr:ABC transporter ATP-binding protein [Lachnospiraceae bacterium]
MNQASEKVIVRLTNVDKNFDSERVVKKLNLDIEEGEFLTLLGPSGCGKTTTLRMIAGFEYPTEGQIFLEGEDVDDKKPNERNVNTVFQNYALFPHMNVFDNIAFGLVEKKVKKEEIQRRVEEMIKLVQLDGMEKRMPSQMSGGQKQRVAIARALVNRPKVLLLDEPLGALDLKLRKQMQGELKHLQRQLGITFIYVTHDQEEALTMSDRIAIMNHGYLEQVGTPEEVYNHPKTKFVADFIGESNIIEGYIENMTDNSIEVTMESGKAVIAEKGYRLEEIIYLCVRPENLKLSTDPVKGFRFRGQVREHVFIGSINKTMIELPNGQMLKAETPAEDELIPVGTVVNVYWNPGKVVVMRTKEEQIYNVIEQSVEIEGMTNDQIF